MAGQVYAIASGKGGVGKTTTAVNLGVVLRRADHTVALVDADLGMANLGPMLGVSGELTIHDVLSGAATVEEALVEEAPGFAVLTGSESLTDYRDADPQHLGDVLDTLAESYDFVLVDTGAGMSHEDVLPLGLADSVILVTSPDPAAFGDTRKTAELAGLAQGEVAGLVVTKAESETDAEQVASAVGVDLLGVIPYDPTVRKSTAAGRPLEATDPETPAAAAYRELANRLADGSAEPSTRPTPDVEAASEPADAAGADDQASDETGPAGDDTESESAPESTTDVEETASPAGSSTAEDESGEPGAEDPDAPAELPESPEPSDADDEPEGTADGEEMAEADEADPLAEFENDEHETTSGFLTRFGRLFR